MADQLLKTPCLSGSFFFELGEKAVLPGYPKRIEDVWGIFGPIDAAFTRMNCQGKTYIFKVCCGPWLGKREAISTSTAVITTTAPQVHARTTVL